MNAQSPYNKSKLNSIIISGKIVPEEQKFYQSLSDPIELVFQHLVRQFIELMYTKAWLYHIDHAHKANFFLDLFRT